MPGQALTLRNYQERAVHDLRNSYRKGFRAPLFVLPTGGGKTCIAAEILRSLTERGRMGLMLVHRRELIHQTSAKLALAGVEHGIIASGIDGADAPVQVASVQTLIRRLDRIDWSPDLIVIDEAHHASSTSWRTILAHWSDAARMGITATPCRLDGRGLGKMFDTLVHGPSMADLIAGEFLTPARIYAPPQVADLSGLRKRAGDYTAEQSAERLDRPTVTGDAIAHYQRLAAGQPAIAFCCTTQHAEHVCNQFISSGIRAATLLGTTPQPERDALVAKLRSGTLQVLVTVDVVSEGFDCPGASVAILLRPTQSLGLYLQQVGRILRPAPGKAHATILDHVGNVHRHGFPDEHRDWTLEDGIRRGSRGPAAPSVRICGVCFAAFKPQPICPVCGAFCAPEPRRQLRQVGGELKELQREGVRQRTAERRKARTLEDLIAVGRARGMRNPVGWARHVHNARQQRSGGLA